MNKKGLFNGLIAVMATLFLFAICSIIFVKFGGLWTDSINSLDESVASNYTKEQITNYSDDLYITDIVFVVFLIFLLIAYIVTSFTLPTQNAWFFLLFVGVLFIVTFIGMILSNSWTFILSDPFFSGVESSVPVTDYVLRHFPVFIFLIGIVGGVIFYSRSKEDFSGGGSAGGFGDLGNNVGTDEFANLPVINNDDDFSTAKGDDFEQ